MDARLTEEQKRVQETAEEFIESNGGIEFARRRMEGEAGVIDELWDDLADLDYTAITVPLEYDGFGEDMVYLAALLEAAGRYALPGPLPETAAVVVPLLRELGSDAQQEAHLPAIADGDVKASFAVYDDRNESLPAAIQLEATTDGETVTLDGTKTLVPYGGEVDRLAVAARTREGTGWDGISLYLVDTDEPGVEATQLPSLDRTRPMYEVTFDGVELDAEAARLGPRDAAGSAVADVMDRYTVATTAMLVGAADEAVDMSATHGNEREQYGQPIGRFQAVKHRIADMWIDMQATRSQLYYAAWAIEDDQPDASHATAALSTYASDRLVRAFTDGMKNHGGMGFTWDHDGHLYLKQAKAWRNFMGTREDYADRLVDARLAELEE